MAMTPQKETARRDLLGHACFATHVVIMLYIVGGWAVPARAALIFYLVFVPAVALHWQINKNACVLNNLESLLRTGRWRNPRNHEEGAWLVTLVRDATGLAFTPAQMDAFSYTVMVALWGVGLLHLRGW
jgi:hypothetical protein